MQVQELIKNYQISLAGPDRLRVNARLAQADGAMDEIKAKKPEIIACLTEKQHKAERAAAERAAKINAIPGLDELRSALEDSARFRAAFRRMMADEHNDGVSQPPKPSTDPEEVASKHPRAAAFVKAETWSHAEHDVKAAAGATALEKIINGEDHEAALAAMEAEWNNYCNKHLWD